MISTHQRDASHTTIRRITSLTNTTKFLLPASSLSPTLPSSQAPSTVPTHGLTASRPMATPLSPYHQASPSPSPAQPSLPSFAHSPSPAHSPSAPLEPLASPFLSASASSSKVAAHCSIRLTTVVSTSDPTVCSLSCPVPRSLVAAASCSPSLAPRVAKVWVRVSHSDRASLDHSQQASQSTVQHVVSDR